MELIETGYKLFCGKKSLKPATSHALQSIRYKVGMWIKQKVDDYGAFAVFETLEQAVLFKNNGYGDFIKRVEFIRSDEKYLWKKNPPRFSRNRYGKGYHAESNGISSLSLDECPTGTILAKEIYIYPESLE